MKPNHQKKKSAENREPCGTPCGAALTNNMLWGGLSRNVSAAAEVEAEK